MFNCLLIHLKWDILIFFFTVLPLNTKQTAEHSSQHLSDASQAPTATDAADHIFCLYQEMCRHGHLFVMKVCCLSESAMGTQENQSQALAVSRANRGGNVALQLSEMVEQRAIIFVVGYQCLSLAFGEYFETISYSQGVPNHGPWRSLRLKIPYKCPADCLKPYCFYGGFNLSLMGRVL